MNFFSRWLCGERKMATYVPRWIGGERKMATYVPQDFRWRVHATLIRSLDGALRRVMGEVEQTSRQIADNFEYQNRVMGSMEDRICALETWKQMESSDGR